MKVTCTKAAAIILLFAGSHTSGLAQQCDGLFLLKPGAEIELTRYDADLKPKAGRMVNKVESKETVEGEEITKVISTNYTETGVANSSTTLIYTCNGKNMYISYDNDAVLGKLYQDFEAIAEKKEGKSFSFASVNDPIEYPLEIKEGIELKGHEITNLMSFKITQKELRQVGLPKQKHNYNSAGIYTNTTESRNYIQVMVDRELATATIIGVRNIKVGAQESVTVPAGTYSCFKITKELYTQVAGKKEFGDMIKSVGFDAKGPSQTITEWYAPGIGPVKTEIRDKSGKVLFILQATKIRA